MEATKKICIDCHVKVAAPKRNICHNCKLKRNYAKHPENKAKHNARNKNAYKYDLNGAKTYKLGYMSEYREGRRDEARETSRLWRIDNPERHKENLRRWYEANKERVARNKQLWTLLHPGAAIHSHRLSKAKRYNAEIGDLTIPLWEEQLEYFNYACAYCFEPLVVITMDHMSPLSRGGPHDIANVVPCCNICNVRKFDKNLLEYLLYPSTRRFIGIGSPIPSRRHKRNR
jgi:hypothetical protein